MIGKDGYRRTASGHLAVPENAKGKPGASGVNGIGVTEERMTREQRDRTVKELQKRIMELRCINAVSELAANPDLDIERLFGEVVEVLPKGWQYREVTAARISFDNSRYETGNMRETKWKMASDMTVSGKRIGAVEIFYLEERPEADEGPFLREERVVLDNVARQLGSALERRWMMSGLRESEAKYRDVSEMATDAIVTADREGRIISWNRGAEKMFGYARDEVLGRPVSILLPERLRESHEDGRRRFAEGDSERLLGRNIEVMGLGKDGAEFPVEYTLSGWNVSGEDYVTAILRDISARKENERELEAANMELKETMEKLKKAQDVLLVSEKLSSIGTLSAGVAHEILNPLNIISTIIQMMEMDDLSPDVRENLDEVMVQVRRATKITNNLRMFAHKRKNEIVAVDVHELFDKTATLIEHDLKLENIAIERSFDPALPLIEADEDQIAQVFLNIMNNARDAMKGRKGNRLSVSTKAMGDEIEIVFADNGPGIPAKYLNRVFDPFFTTKSPGEGTGLGLSMLHTVIREHYGNISVDSAEGSGAAFTIRLPVKHEPPFPAV